MSRFRGLECLRFALMGSLFWFLWAGAQAQATFMPQAPNAIEAPASILGTWGTQAQCAAHRRGETDDMRLLPYEIGDQWLKHGFLYCWMGWRAHRQEPDGSTTIVLARCGEDAVRFFQLVIRHTGPTLRMRWSKDYETPALERCQ